MLCCCSYTNKTDSTVCSIILFLLVHQTINHLTSNTIHAFQWHHTSYIIQLQKLLQALHQLWPWPLWHQLVLVTSFNHNVTWLQHNITWFPTHTVTWLSTLNLASQHKQPLKLHSHHLNFSSLIHWDNCLSLVLVTCSTFKRFKTVQCIHITGQGEVARENLPVGFLVLNKTSHTLVTSCNLHYKQMSYLWPLANFYTSHGTWDFTQEGVNCNILDHLHLGYFCTSHGTCNFYTGRNKL